MGKFLKNKKVLVPVLALVVVLGAWKVVFAKSPAEKHKIEGEVYVLPKEFLVNLADGRYAKVSVALVLAPGGAAASGGGHGGGGSPPEGYGPLPQEAVVRDVVVDELTAASDRDLIDRAARHALKRRIARAIEKHSDVKVEDVLFTDVTVQ